MSEDDNDDFTAEAFAQQREPLWALTKLVTPELTRAEFDARFDAALVEMLREESAP